MPDTPASDRLLVVVRSATPERPDALAGWDVRNLVVARQVEVPSDRADFLAALERAPSLAVTSPRAARWLASQGVPEWSRRPVVVAGPRTAENLPGWECIVPDGLGGAAVGEVLSRLGWSKALYLCADETAGTLEASCIAHGIELVRWICYRTIPVEELDDQASVDLDLAHSLAFLAPSAVDFLRSLAPDAFARAARFVPAVASGAETCRRLRASGWGEVLQAEGPTLSQLAHALGGAS